MDEDVKIRFREEQATLIKLLEALEGLEKSKEWEVLKTLVFSKSIQAIERQILSESLNQTIDANKLYRLQGEWAWAKQYSDTDHFIDTLKKQLANIKKKLNDE